MARNLDDLFNRPNDATPVERAAPAAAPDQALPPHLDPLGWLGPTPRVAMPNDRAGVGIPGTSTMVPSFDLPPMPAQRMGTLQMQFIPTARERAAAGRKASEDPFAFLGEDFVDDDENDSSFWSWIGGRVVSSIGGLATLAGVLTQGAEDMIGNEDGQYTAASEWLKSTGAELSNYGADVMDRSHSEKARERQAAFQAAFEDESVPWLVRAARGVGELFGEGGLEVVSFEVAGTLADMLVGGGAGAAARGAANVTARQIARASARATGREVRDAAGKKVARDGSESLLEAMAGASVARRGFKGYLDRVTDAKFVGMATLAGGQTAADAYASADAALTELGERRKQMVGWQETREAIMAATGRVPTDAEVDERFKTALAAQSGLVGLGATLGLSSAVPISEGAVARVLSGAGLRKPTIDIMPPVRTGALATTGRVAGRVAGGALLEGASEGVEEAVQSGLGSPEAARVALEGRPFGEQLMVGVGSPSGLSGATLGAIIGAGYGGAIRGVAPPRPVDLTGPITESQRRAAAGTAVEADPNDPFAGLRTGQETPVTTLTPEAQAELDALRARAAGGDPAAIKAVETYEQDIRLREQQVREARAAREQTQRAMQAEAQKRWEARMADNAKRANAIRFSAVVAGTGANPESLGGNPSFGFGSSHEGFADSDGRRVFFSTANGALAADTNAATVLYASKEKPGEWQPLSKAPQAFQRAARAALVMASKESAPELNYEPGLELAAALPTIATANLDTDLLDATTRAAQGAAQAAIDAARMDALTAAGQANTAVANLEQAAAVDPTVLRTHQQLVAQAERKIAADLWHRFERDKDQRGLLPAPASAFADGSPIGLDDYKRRLTETYTERRDNLTRILQGTTPRDERDARALVTKELASADLDLNSATAQEVIRNRADAKFLASVAGGRTRQIPVNGRRTRVSQGARAAAQVLLQQHELRRIYARTLDAHGQLKADDFYKVQRLVGDVGAAAAPGAAGHMRAQIDALLNVQESEIAARPGGLLEAQAAAMPARAELFGANLRAAEINSDARDVAMRADQAAEALASAQTIPEVLASLSFIPPTRASLTIDAAALKMPKTEAADIQGLLAGVGVDEQAHGLSVLTGTTPMQLFQQTMDATRILNEVTAFVPAAEGPSNVYGSSHPISDMALTGDLTVQYANAVAELAVVQLAMRIRNGDPASDLLRSLVTDYGVPNAQAANLWLRANQEANMAGEGVTAKAVLQQKIDAAQAQADAVVEQAAKEAGLIEAQAAPAPAAEGGEAPAPAKRPKTKAKAKTKGRAAPKGMASEAGELLPDYVPNPTNMDPDIVERFATQKRTQLAHLADVLNIRVHRTLADFKREVSTPINNVAGFFQPPTEGSGDPRSTIHLVADRFENEAQLERKFRHELLGHFGLTRLLGPSLDLLMNDVVDLVQRGKGAAADTVRRFYNAVYDRYAADIRADMIARYGQPETDEDRAGIERLVRNRMDQITGYVTQEAVASIVEYSAEGSLQAQTVAPVTDRLRGLLSKAGLTAKGTADLVDYIRQADAFLNSSEHDLIKRLKTAHATHNRQAYEAAENAPFIRTSKAARLWASITSDMAGVRQLAAIIERMIPADTEAGRDAQHRARNLIRELESAITRVQSYQQDVLQTYVAPLRRKLGEIKKETNRTEEEIYAYYSSYMIAKHAGERNRSFYLIHNKSGFTENVIAERDRIYNAAVASANPEVWADTLSRIEAVINSDPVSAATMERDIGSMDYIGVSGFNQRGIDRLMHDIPEAMKQAFERHDVSALNRGANEAILDMRRRSGLYGEEGYRRIMIHGWNDYVPLSKQEGAYYAGDVLGLRGGSEAEPDTDVTPTGESHEVKPKGPDGGLTLAAGTYANIQPWFSDGPEGLFATHDRARNLRDSVAVTPDLVPMLMHTLERDSYYAAHELVNADIGREAILLFEAMIENSPGHEARIRKQYMDVSAPYTFSDPPPQGFNPHQPNTLMVGLADGRRQVIHFKDEMLARSFLSRFNDPLSGKSEVTKKFASVTKFMSRAFTTFNPAWVMVKQFPRDIQQNIMIAMGEHGIGASKAMGMVGTAMAYVPRFEKFFLASPERQQEMLDAAFENKSDPLHNFALRHREGGIPLFDDSLLAYSNRAGQIGAEFSTTDALTRADLTSSQFALQRGTAAVQATARAINRVANANATAFDNAARQALWDVLVAPKEQGGAGLTNERAASVVRNTLNFTNRSEAGRFLTPYFSFAQTALTSLDAAWEARLWREGRNPRGAQPDGQGGYKVALPDGWLLRDINWPWVGARIAMGALSVGAMAMLFSDKDDEGRSEFEKLDPRTIMTNLLIPNPFGDEPIRIPMQLGFDSFFHSLGALGALKMFSDPAAHNTNSFANEFLQVATQSLTPFSTELGEPITPGSILDVVLPTALQPWYGAGTSRGLLERAEDTPGLYARTSVNPFVTGTVRGLEDLTGFGVAPETARQFMQDYGGGLWRAIDHATRFIATRDENMQLVQDDGPAAALSNFIGASARDVEYDAQQSYYYLTGIEQRFDAMVARAKAMDAWPAGTSYSPLEVDPSTLTPNMRRFHEAYGVRYGIMRKATADARQELALIRSQVDVARTSGNDSVVGSLLARERRVYEVTAARMRQALTDPGTGRMLPIEEPKFVRWYAR